jgi:hypothetical protein
MWKIMKEAMDTCKYPADGRERIIKIITRLGKTNWIDIISGSKCRNAERIDVD